MNPYFDILSSKVCPILKYGDIYDLQEPMTIAIFHSSLIPCCTFRKLDNVLPPISRYLLSPTSIGVLKCLFCVYFKHGIRLLCNIQ